MKNHNKLIIFLLLFVICLILLYFTNNSLEQMSNPMKILHLVLFSHDGSSYDNMYKITSEYYKRFPNVNTIYYTYNSDILNPYELKNDILYIKGNETYIPGILDKTIQAFEYFENDLYKYDYIVRSNISTIINFDLLNDYLVHNPVDYASGMMNDLQINIKHKQIDSYRNVYASGTSIIMSIPTIQLLLQGKHLLHRDLIDDVAIGLYIHDNSDITFKNINENGDKFISIPDMKGNLYELQNIVNLDKNIFYRNRCSDDRNVDYYQMKHLLEILQE